jgi:dihydrofolate reductase
MSKVIWHTMMSLDGFIAGPDDSMDWAWGYGGTSEVADDTRDATGAILAGRRWYDVASERYDGVAGIYGGNWTGPVFVLTHRPDDVPQDTTVAFLSQPLAQAVATARDAAGTLAVGIFGADIARQCLDAGLLDEIVVHIAPVLLGDGVRFYGGEGADEVQLERLDVNGAQITDLRFRVAKGS